VQEPVSKGNCSEFNTKKYLAQCLLEPLNTRNCCNHLESYHFHTSDTPPTQGWSLIWMAILQPRHL